MDRRYLRYPLMTALVSVCLLLTACSNDPAATAALPTPLVTAPAVDPSETPAARSGDLGQEDLPAPDELGRGWKYRVDLGNAEDGYLGSGTPATARDPESVLAAITPLGCQPLDLPLPTRALEVTYQRQATPAVGLLLQFDDDAIAQAFFDLHATVIRECLTAPRANVRVLNESSTRFVSTRTEDLGETPSWVEGMTVAGNEVTLIAVANPSAAGIRSVQAALA